MIDIAKRVVDTFDRVTEVGLIGSCVARDFRQSAFRNVTKTRYLWRINTASLVSKASTAITLEKLKLPEDENKTFYNDLNKTFRIDQMRDMDVILIDFVRDFYQVGQLKDGRLMTIGQEIEKYGIKKHLPIETIYSPYKPDYPDLWFRSFQDFIKLTSDFRGMFLIVSIRNRFGRRTDGKIEVPPSFNALDLAYKNRLLFYMEAIAGLLLPNAVTVPYLSEFAELDPNHEFGLGPIHYLRRYYDDLVANLRLQPGRLLTNAELSPGERRAAVDQLRARWQKEAKRGYWDA